MTMIEEEPIELELGLSLGGNYGTRRRLQEPGPGSADLGSGASSGFPAPVEEAEEGLKSKREVQALRRMEAKKKRDEKQLKRALSKGGGGGFPASVAAYLNNGGGEEPEYKKNRIGLARSESGLGSNSLQLGLGQSGVTAPPSWLAGIGVAERSVIRPVARYGFRGAFENDSERNGGGGIGSNGSIVCSSSAGSDNRSSASREGGGSIDSRSNSIQSIALLEQPRFSSGIKIHPELIAAFDHPHIDSTKATPSNDAQFDPRKPTQQSKSDNASSVENPEPPKSVPNPAALPYMPSVSTTGNGPNGKTVQGYLYRYAKGEEVSIVCACHGSSFSPAEFVQHAGGVDVSNPLKHITVVPSAI